MESEYEIESYLTLQKFEEICERIDNKIKDKYSEESNGRRFSQQGIEDYKKDTDNLEHQINNLIQLMECNHPNIRKLTPNTIRQLISIELKVGKDIDEIYDNLVHESGVINADINETKETKVIRGLKDVHTGANLYGLFLIMVIFDIHFNQIK